MKLGSYFIIMICFNFKTYIKLYFCNTVFFVTYNVIIFKFKLIKNIHKIIYLTFLNS